MDTLRTMASGLLQVKTEDLKARVGKRWTERFLKRNGQLETAFSRALDDNRAKATYPGTIGRWFHLLTSVIKEYKILIQHIYNFDEKGVLMEMASATKVIVKVKDRRRFKTQPGNRICNSGNRPENFELRDALRGPWAAQNYQMQHPVSNISSNNTLTKNI